MNWKIKMRIQILLWILILMFWGCREQAVKNTDRPETRESKKKLTLFVGAASKPPAEEIIALFEQKTGVRVEANFGGSGYVLSQMKLAKTGDIFFPGSSDFMEKAKAENLVFSETERIPVYLVTSINVQKGNPRKIRTLKDLLKPGLRLAIANPENVCVGTYAVEVIEKNLSPAERVQFQRNLVNYTESCDKTATVIALKSVDAVIGWEVFQYWNPEAIETIDLKPSEIIRVGYIPISISRYTQNKELAQQFIDFIMGEEAKAIFKKYRYFTSPEEAFEYIGEVKPVGGLYNLPKEWILN